MEYKKYKAGKMKSFNRGVVWSFAKINALLFGYSRPTGVTAKSRELCTLKVNVKIRK
jgi:hypothetical protein